MQVSIDIGNMLFMKAVIRRQMWRVPSSYNPIVTSLSLNTVNLSSCFSKYICSCLDPLFNCQSIRTLPILTSLQAGIKASNGNIIKHYNFACHPCFLQCLLGGKGGSSASFCQYKVYVLITTAGKGGMNKYNVLVALTLNHQCMSESCWHFLFVNTTISSSNVLSIIWYSYIISY